MDTAGLIRRIEALLARQDAVRVAVDGGSASGKSTLAAALAARLDAALFHMDDFFLPPALRTPQRLAEPGGNVHRERFLEEVLPPLLAGETVTYRPFDCSVMALADPVTVPPRRVSIVEGAYSHHPALGDYAHLRVFLAVPPQIQRARILARNGAGAQDFFDRWIPMENRYFEHFSIRERADMVIELNP